MVPTESTARTVSDVSLIARVLANDDRAAFAELVNRHQRGVRSLLHRLTRGDAALSDDLAQETFVRLYRHLNQYRAEARFSTWLYRIAYNAFLGHVRKSPPTAVTLRPSSAELLATEIPNGTKLQAQQVDVARAVAQLNDAERAAVIYCYFEDMSHEQAAQALNLPLGTLKSQLLRARHKLRVLLAAWQPGTGQG